MSTVDKYAIKELLKFIRVKPLKFIMSADLRNPVAKY